MWKTHSFYCFVVSVEVGGSEQSGDLSTFLILHRLKACNKPAFLVLYIYNKERKPFEKIK